MKWKQIEEKLVTAILEQDAAQIGHIVDVLRFQWKLNYTANYELARQLTGICEAEWDELLYEADCKASAA